MPIPIASSVFHGSCPTRPGRRYARTSSAGASGSVIRPAARFIGWSFRRKRQPKLPFYPLREGTSTRGRGAFERAGAARGDAHQAEACLAALVAGFFFVYFWRNFSTRPAVSTIFCLPV